MYYRIMHSLQNNEGSDENLEFGQLIKNARKSKGYTQEHLGKMVGLQKSAIAKYENGRVVNIKRSTLQKLAKALDLKGSDLILEVEANPKEAAKLHSKVLMDNDLMDVIKLYYTLNEDKQKMVRDLIRNLAE